MGKKKGQSNAGGGSMRRDMIRKGGNKSRKRDEYVFRTAEDIIASEKESGKASASDDVDVEDNDDSDYDTQQGGPKDLPGEAKDIDLRSAAMTSSVYMWEFGQNDAKRDSGSKLCRLGYASTLRFNSSFNGIVLSSEGKSIISPADLDIIQQYGVAGINCSWNKIDGIPFEKLGTTVFSFSLLLDHYAL